METNTRQDVPLVEAKALLQWVYQTPEQVYLAGKDHQRTLLGSVTEFLTLVQQAQAQGYAWVLIDGPRPSRVSWILDLHWSEQPQLSPKMIQLARSHCLSLEDLEAAIHSSLS
jgi:phage protein U